MINRRDFIQLGASSILALSASRFAFAKSDTQVDLRIVATTDIHSFLTDFDYYKDAPTEKFGFTRAASLIRRAAAECDRVVVSVFVNPTQFGPNEDLESYPRDLEHDTLLIKECGGNLVFAPQPADMYGQGTRTWVTVEGLTKELCGRSRPIHFRGVATVVCKLMNIAQPDRAYFGQKDAQQLAVIRQMVSDLNMPVQVVGCPIVRESDGLAKSSRNTYLNAQERQAALVLSRSLAEGRKLLEAGTTDTGRVLARIEEVLKSEPLARIDYVQAVDADTIEPVHKVSGNVLFAIAVYIGKTRLIDNFYWTAE